MFELHGGILLILGLSVFLGIIGATLFQKLRIPQVVGYIAIGLLIGESGLKIVSAADVEHLNLFNQFALGIIGFMVGGELQIATFKKYFRQFVTILFGEGLMSCLLVGSAVTAVLYFVIGSDVENTLRWQQAIAGGIIFGAIASATDPASTLDVLWEFRSKGIMTSAIVAIVALDDALALTLYGLGTAVAKILVGSDSSVSQEMFKVFIELSGAALCGLAFALILSYLMKFVHNNPEKNTAFSFGVIMSLIGITIYFDLDVIIATMTLGFVLTNLVPHRSEKVFELLRGFTIPIYVMFFVLVGARIALGSMPAWLWLIVVIYVICRSAGKYLGARLGAKISKSDENVRKYLGLGILSQGGVAIGLAIVASNGLKDVMIGDLSLGNIIITGITATTLIVQIIGPAMVKVASKLSGEINRNITKEDILETMTVEEVIENSVPTLTLATSLEKVINLFSTTKSMIFPVVDNDKKLLGVVTLDSVREVLSNNSTWKWLLVDDIVEQSHYIADNSHSVKLINETMIDMNLNEAMIVDTEKNFCGIITTGQVKVNVNKKLIANDLQQ